MATKKRGRPRKEPLKKEVEKHSYGFLYNIILIAVGAFLFLGFFFSANIGAIGGGIIGFFKSVLGQGLVLVALFLVGLGAYNLYKKEGKGAGFYAGLSFLTVAVLITCHIPYLATFSSEELMNVFLNQLGGGIVGAVLADGLYTALGSIGFYIVLLLIYVVAIAFIINNIHMLRRLKETSQERFQEMREDRAMKKSLMKEEKELVRRKKREQKNREMMEAEHIKRNMLEKETFDEEGKKEEIKHPMGLKPRFSDDGEEIKLPTFNPTPLIEEEEDLPIIEPAVEEVMTPPVTSKASVRSGHKKWKLPALNLLKDIPKKEEKRKKQEIENTAALLEETLKSFGVNIKVNEVSCGPALTRYEATLAPGTKVSKIQNLSEDIALSLAATTVRIEAPIPGKSAVGFEIPNKVVTPISFKEVIESSSFKRDSAPLSFALGKDITGKTIVTTLSNMPHLLIAGATGSGKSVCLNTLICSLLYKYTPDEVKFLMIDPKKVELSPYNDIPHLVAPVVTDPKRSAVALKWMVGEMETRYQQLSDQGVRDIKSYNDVVDENEKMPYIVVIIDELSDLMMAAPVDVETSICRIAQKARAAGIHLIVATQRPSVQVITGDIKSNIPTRIAFAVFSQIDARTILDSAGAEKLLGNGDMLFTLKGGKLLRIQGAYISEDEIMKITTFLKDQGKPEYLGGCEVIETEELEEADEKKSSAGEEDPFVKDAARLVLESGQASISMLQRRLKVGYSRAARLIDLLEEKGFVGPFEGTKSREVLGNWEDFGTLFGEDAV